MKQVRESDPRMEELFERAHRDPQLKKKLLADPVAVAKEWKVELGEREVEQLKKLNTFLEVAEEISLGSLYPPCNPLVCYPVSVWRNQAVVDLVSILEKWRWIFYPPPDFIPGRDLQIDFRQRRRFGG
jgi:hypothetical protein